MCVKKIYYEGVVNLIRGVGRIIRFSLSNKFLAKGCSRMIFATFHPGKVGSKSFILLNSI